MPAPFPPRPGPAGAHAASHLARAARLREAGRFADSVAPMLQAVRLDPGNPVILHDLGLTFLELGRMQDAASALQRAAAIKPDFAEAHWRLGLALERLNEPSGAIEAYRAATRLQPALGEAQYRLAILLEDAGHRTEAIERFRRARSSAQDVRVRRLAEARALMAENRDAEAQRALRRAVALDPADTVALDLLGGVLAEAGAFEEAADIFQSALDRSPGMVGCYYDLARCRPVVPSDGLVERMMAARELPDLNDEALSKLNLALGKALDDLGRYEEAMMAFDAAFVLRAKVVKFDAAKFARQADVEIARFTPGLVARAASLGNPDPTPVMVLGMPRSGTTLCEQILSSHSAVGAGGELQFWNRRGAMMQTAGEGAPDPAFVAEVATAALRFLRPIAPLAQRITDKMPFNFLWAGLIHLAFPNATIVHCRRSPVDTALSIHQTFFSPRLDFPTGGDDLVAYYRTYQRLVEHWRRVLPPDRFIEIDYETLTEDPEPHIRRMVAAMALPWEEACLHPERNDRVVKTPSKWQAKQPINRNAVDRWRRYEPYLGPLAQLIGS